MADTTSTPLVGTWVDHETWRCGQHEAASHPPNAADHTWCALHSVSRPPDSSRPAAPVPRYECPDCRDSGAVDGRMCPSCCVPVPAASPPSGGGTLECVHGFFLNEECVGCGDEHGDGGRIVRFASGALHAVYSDTRTRCGFCLERGHISDDCPKRAQYVAAPVLPEAQRVTDADVDTLLRVFQKACEAAYGVGSPVYPGDDASISLKERAVIRNEIRALILDTAAALTAARSALSTAEARVRELEALYVRDMRAEGERSSLMGSEIQTLINQLATSQAEALSVRADLEEARSNKVETVREYKEWLEKCAPRDVELFAKQSDAELATNLEYVRVYAPTACHALLNAAVDRIRSRTILRETVIRECAAVTDRYRADTGGPAVAPFSNNAALTIRDWILRLLTPAEGPANDR